MLKYQATIITTWLPFTVVYIHRLPRNIFFVMKYCCKCMLNIKKHLYLHYYLVFSVLYMTELTKNRFYSHVLMATRHVVSYDVLAITI